MLPTPAPKKKPFEGQTEWKKHWLKIAKENPQLKTNKERNKIANEEWLKTHKKKRYI